ncbi:MAG: sulfite exporter TauE/SafE family protein [Xanthomonadales bacterium]|nr:sulfite exporter TauE/SafE family protein [Xanthomonadales bacterium]
MMLTSLPMLQWLLICGVGFGASLLTFFSGFGLGTLLLPAFALFFPAEAALMMTAVVHLLNNGFKITLLYRFVDRSVLLRFGLPAIVAAVGGSALLVNLSGAEPIFEYTLAEREFAVRPVGLVIGLLMVAFALRELADLKGGRGFDPKWLPVGGLVSGFFGGLSGHQGALRSAFLMKAGLGKEAFLATGVAVAILVDLGRLSLYLPAAGELARDAPLGLLAAATLSAFAGAALGRRLLHKVTLVSVYRVVGVFLIAAGLLIAAGVI